MVTLERDVIQIRDAARAVARRLGLHRLPPLGAMIETPAAALTVPDLIRHVDFLSIGSNDLTQYTLAAGRENPSVNSYFLDDHPAVLRLLTWIVRDAGTTPVALCGEVAGRPAALPALVQTGLRSFSVASSLLPAVRQAIAASWAVELPP